MAEPSEPFDPTRFVDPETGDIADFEELFRQAGATIESGVTGPLLEYLVDRIRTADEPEERLLSAVLIDVVERGEHNPDAVRYQAGRLAERHEERGEYGSAAGCCGLVISVLSEQARFKEADSWLARLRRNLFHHAEEELEADSALARHTGTVVRGALEHESAYLLEVAGSGRAKRVREKVTELLQNPASPSEQHILESTLAFIELDLGSPLRAKQVVSSAEEHAIQAGDHADAAIYACRRANYTLISMGSLGKGSARAALATAREHLTKAREANVHPKYLEKANEAFRGMQEVLSL